MLSAEIFRVLYDKDENNENDNDTNSPTADAPAGEADDDISAPAGVIMDDDPDDGAEEAVQPPIPDENTGEGDFNAADDDESNFY